jgi:hypothetical protein
MSNAATSNLLTFEQLTHDPQAREMIRSMDISRSNSLPSPDNDTVPRIRTSGNAGTVPEAPTR